MTTHWTVEIPNSGLKTYLWCRADGFPDHALESLRETYRAMKKILETSIWNPQEALFALLFIRNETEVEGFIETIECRHAMVLLQKKEIILVGDWYPPFEERNYHGVYDLEVAKEV